jgi:ribulose-phosphate 3-epimerase
MIEHPERFIEAFRKSGADWISVHAEACPHLHRTIQQIKETGARAGVALNPGSPITLLDAVLSDLDYVLIMTVDPGFGGQKFIPGCLEKIRRLRSLIDDAKLTVDIEVDGGIKIDNIADIASAGGNIFVAGSAVFQSKDYAVSLAAMRQRIEMT